MLNLCASLNLLILTPVTPSSCEELMGERLGVEDGRIPMSQLNASSFLGHAQRVECGRLNSLCGDGGWLYAKDDPHKWFEVM